MLVSQIWTVSRSARTLGPVALHLIFMLFRDWLREAVEPGKGTCRLQRVLGWGCVL